MPKRKRAATAFILDESALNTLCEVFEANHGSWKDIMKDPDIRSMACTKKVATEAIQQQRAAFTHSFMTKCIDNTIPSDDLMSDLNHWKLDYTFSHENEENTLCYTLFNHNRFSLLQEVIDTKESSPEKEKALKKCLQEVILTGNIPFFKWFANTSKNFSYLMELKEIPDHNFLQIFDVALEYFDKDNQEDMIAIRKCMLLALKEGTLETVKVIHTPNMEWNVENALMKCQDDCRLFQFCLEKDLGDPKYVNGKGTLFDQICSNGREQQFLLLIQKEYLGKLELLNGFLLACSKGHEGIVQEFFKLPLFLVDPMIENHEISECIRQGYKESCLTGNVVLFRLFHAHGIPISYVGDQGTILECALLAAANGNPDIMMELSACVDVDINMAIQPIFFSYRYGEKEFKFDWAERVHPLVNVFDWEVAQRILQRSDLYLPPDFLVSYVSRGEIQSKKEIICELLLQDPRVELGPVLWRGNQTNLLSSVIDTPMEWTVQQQAENDARQEITKCFLDCPRVCKISQSTLFIKACKVHLGVAALLLLEGGYYLNQESICGIQLDQIYHVHSKRQLKSFHYATSKHIIEDMNFLVKDPHFEISPSFIKTVCREKVASTAALILQRGHKLPNRLAKKFMENVEEAAYQLNPSRAKSARSVVQ